MTEARQFGARPDAACDVARSTIALERIRHVAGDACCSEGDFVGTVGDAVFGEHRAKRTERGGLECVDTDLEEVFVHGGNQVGSGHGEQFVATFEVLAAEIVSGEILALHVGAEGAVKDHDTFVDGLQIARSFLSRHRCLKAKTSSV